MTKFYDHVMQEAREISRIVRGYVDMIPLTEQQAYDYEQAVTCGTVSYTHLTLPTKRIV